MIVAVVPVLAVPVVPVELKFAVMRDATLGNFSDLSGPRRSVLTVAGGGVGVGLGVGLGDGVGVGLGVGVGEGVGDGLGLGEGDGEGPGVPTGGGGELRGGLLEPPQAARDRASAMTEAVEARATTVDFIFS